MEVILWIFIVAAVLIAFAGLFAWARTRQRRGDILASQSATKGPHAQSGQPQ